MFQPSLVSDFFKALNQIASVPEFIDCEIVSFCPGVFRTREAELNCCEQEWSLFAMEAQDRKCGACGHQGASVTLFFPWRSSFPCKDDSSWNIDRVLQGLPGLCPPRERAHSCILSGSNLIAGAQVCVAEGFLRLLLLFML